MDFSAILPTENFSGSVETFGAAIEGDLNDIKLLEGSLNVGIDAVEVGETDGVEVGEN
ncbi:hypothetical protein PIB30_083068 [Stylosanthes scabra]|uniref:Uncharacterized protein n=1 Tax=Stylosanthes scabra TaxID=79078 RepID=A0ABU6ZQV2_9FABA|nr:hypothetical protein [Stylosanthes scabra]